MRSHDAPFGELVQPTRQNLCRGDHGDFVACRELARAVVNPARVSWRDLTEMGGTCAPQFAVDGGLNKRNMLHLLE
jgi:hypothetical protein